MADLPRTWKTPRHIHLIDTRLVDLVRGYGSRIAIFAPPRHGKSVLTSHYFPAWYLLNCPDRNVILTSYEADFASKWGRKVRDTVTKWGQLGFNLSVRDDSKAANRWEIEGHSGGMETAGAGGAILGKGANLFIIDDPVKNAEEALSPTYRQKVWDWYLSTAETRLEPGACVVITQQRWHTEDLGGRLLKEQPNDWDVVNIRAIAEADDPPELERKIGDPLWPERYPLEELERRRRNAPTWFAAQYQQHPLDLEGGFFKGLEKIKFLDVAPTPDQFTRIVRAWDLASTEAQAGADPDWTAGVKMGKHKDGGFYILDVIRERLGPRSVRDKIKQIADLDGTGVYIRIEREGGASGKITSDTIVREDLPGFKAASIKPTTGKEERAEPYAAQVEAGNVVIVKNGHTAALLDEHRQFPNGSHDDMVDACSLAFGDVARPAAVAYIGGERI